MCRPLECDQSQQLPYAEDRRAAKNTADGTRSVPATFQTVNGYGTANAMTTLQARLARGDQAAFAELYDACADRVGHYLLVRLGSWADADDALQETFCRLARTRRNLRRWRTLMPT